MSLNNSNQENETQSDSQEQTMKKQTNDETPKERTYLSFIKRHEHCQNEMCKKDVEFAKKQLQDLRNDNN